MTSSQKRQLDTVNHCRNVRQRRQPLHHITEPSNNNTIATIIVCDKPTLEQKSPPSSPPLRKGILRNSSFTKEPLKGEASNRATKIRFDKMVSVVTIPSRFSYSELVRKALWSNMQEISQTARRNTIEFAAEGWDWRAATEDDAMYVCANGDRIHPAHVMRRGVIVGTKYEC